MLINIIVLIIVKNGVVFYLQLQFIGELLGQPADHILDNGDYTENYYRRTPSNGWRLKVPQSFIFTFSI